MQTGLYETEVLIMNLTSKMQSKEIFSKSLSNVVDLINLSKRVMSVLQSHGFCLTKWMSNSPELLHSVPISKMSANIVSLDFNIPTLVRTFSMI